MRVRVRASEGKRGGKKGGEWASKGESEVSEESDGEWARDGLVRDEKREKREEKRLKDRGRDPTCITILLQYSSNLGSHSLQNILPAGGSCTQVTFDSRRTRSSSSEKVRGEGTNISSRSGMMSLMPHPKASARSPLCQKRF